MKITQEGTPLEFLLQGICPICNCKFECNYEEAEARDATDFRGDSCGKTYHFKKCPQEGCDATNILLKEFKRAKKCCEKTTFG